MPRDSRAQQPPAGYARPRPLSTNLVITPVSESGEPLGRWDFSVLPGSLAIRQALAEEFANAVDVGGRWKSSDTIRNAYVVVGNFLRWLDSQGHDLATVSDLTAAVWDEYVLGVPPSVAAARLTQLRDLLTGTGQLTPRASQAVNKRGGRYEVQVQSTLTTEQARKILRVGHRILDAAHQRITSGWALLADYHAGRLEEGSEEAQWGALLAHIEEHLDVPRIPKPGRTMTPAIQRLVGTSNSMPAMERLFLSAHEAGAFMALMGIYEGWNPDVIKTFTTADVQRADSGDEDWIVYNIALDKPRRGAWRHVQNNLVETGPRCGAAALRMVLEITEPARTLLARRGTAVDHILVHLHASMQNYRRSSTGPLTNPGASEASARRNVKRFAESVDLRDDAGQPVRWHRKMLRRYSTTQVRPQGHSEATNANVYRLNDAKVRESSVSVFEDGLNGALAHATATVLKMPLAGTEGAASSGLDPDTAQAIDSGALDTPVGSCKDIRHSPLNNGQQCNVTFLMCLGCTNAVVIPRHLPRIVYLHQRLDTMRQNLPEGPLWKRWVVHWLRLTDLLDNNFTDVERTAAAAAITDAERSLIDGLIARRYDA